MGMDKGKIIKKNDKILAEIKGYYDKGTLAAFIGAGFSKNIKDSPTWKEFIKKLTHLFD